MPPIGLLVGGVDFTDLKVVLKDASIDEAGKAVSAVTINYVAFIQTTIDFLIVAFAIFLMIKAMNRMIRKEVPAPAAPAAPPEPTKEEKLLAEIRDLLKK
jgi:large conductance mechanosensitive channel